MSRNTVVYTLVALFFLSTGSVLQASEGWLTDYEAAKKQAAKEGKDILMDFTGSDWCGWCKLMDKGVFAQEEWQKFLGHLTKIQRLQFVQALHYLQLRKLQELLGNI